jgi:hypothetical protein
VNEVSTKVLGPVHRSSVEQDTECRADMFVYADVRV